MKASRILEGTLWAGGLLAGLYSLYYVGTGALEQYWGERELRAALASPAPAPTKHKVGDLLGRIEIPRLDISAVVFEGTDDAQLRRGVGHYPGGDLGSGNTVLAAHRDTFFRDLEHVRVGDRIHFSTPSGKLTYAVHETRIVKPTAVEVLKDTEDSIMTLITCYPFEFFGHAPERFIVRAQRVY